MWFKDKKQAEEPEIEPRTTRRRQTDMRSELGLSGSDSGYQPRTVRPTVRRAAAQVDTSTVYNEDVQLNDLKIRARRRLIGALVLLAAAFVILPWVFDDSRKQTAPTVTVNVPDKNLQFDVKNPRAADTTVVVDNLKPTPSSSDKTSDKTAAPKVEAKTDTKPAVVTDKTPVSTQKFLVHIGIVSDTAELNALMKRLSAAGVSATRETITVNGVSKTRVRLGPFDSQTDAQVAANKAKSAAKNPIVIPLK
ncbi:SPOR domain-containing protein [Hydromonas duriensis]|uniref:DedD protein n=1 Tax=Hydromonas duriensis TaxID=1527608 RepID=A0A4R6Y3W4_9BURK|nr:SPOR domain-containing protein [Hydromonas duriensis]TDR31071.1 DedD protein [Hydromonas duriensis]